MSQVSDESDSFMEIDSDLGSSGRRRRRKRSRESDSASSSSDERRVSVRKRFRKQRKQGAKRAHGSSSSIARNRGGSRADAIIRSVFPDTELETLYDRYVDMNVVRLEQGGGDEVVMFDRVLSGMRGRHATTLPNRVGSSSSSAAAAAAPVPATRSLTTVMDDIIADTSALVQSSLHGKAEVDSDDADDTEYHAGASRENPATVPIKFYEQGIPLTGVTDANVEVEYESYGADVVGMGWTSYFEETYHHLRDEHDRMVRSMKSVSEVEFYLDPNTHNVDTPGGLRFKAVQEQLDSYGVVRSVDQRTFHEAMINATLPLIYGDSWEECSTGVMRERKIEKVDQEALILAPRRWGKTWAVAMYVGALLLHVPGIKVAVFSPTGRQSGFLKEYILDFVCRARLGRKRIVRDKNEELFIAQFPLPAGKGQHSAVAKEWASSPLTSRAYFLPGTVVAECAVDYGGVRCMVEYPKLTVDYNRTLTQHVCSGHGFFSRYYGKCLCDFGWETFDDESGHQTGHGFYQCNVGSTAHSGYPVNPWATGEGTSFSDDESCDCSMEWTRYTHRSINYGVALVRMWGVHVDTLNVSTKALADQMARQLCYLHYDCLATTIAATSLSDHLYTVKFWAHGAGSIVWTDHIVNNAATTLYRVNRYAWSADGSVSDCDENIVVSNSHLAATQLSLYHATNTHSPTDSNGAAWQRARFYEYFHRHPELVTPYSTCKRAQPAVGDQCQYPLCPPMSVGISVGVVGVSTPCTSHGYCKEPSAHASSLGRADADSIVECVCDEGFTFNANGLEQACQVSNIDGCSLSGIACSDSTCCEGRGTCRLSVDLHSHDVTTQCHCGATAKYHDWTGPFCNSSVCNPETPTDSCVATDRGVCLTNRDIRDYHCACTYSKGASTGYASLDRVWDTDYDEDDANCDGSLTSGQLFMCYEPASYSATEPLDGAKECGGQGRCVQVDCTAFSDGESCRQFPQACKWLFINATAGSCEAWVSGTTYTCACASGVASNANWYHGKGLTRGDMPQHCVLPRLACGACDLEFGNCAKDVHVNEPVCSCYEDDGGYAMSEGDSCNVQLYNETDCSLSFGGTDDIVTLTCACDVNHGPYCNLTCPVHESEGVKCDRGDCALTGTEPCGQSSENATSCTCVCNDNVESHLYSVLSGGYCQNPCNGHGYWKYIPSEWQCVCEYGSNSSNSGTSTGYDGDNCEHFTCDPTSMWDPALGPDGQCVCATGHTGALCTSCLAGYYRDDDRCVVCPNCVNGPYKLLSTCSSSGSCNCPDEYPVVLSTVCAVSACVNSTGGNCNGTDWGVCDHYDNDRKSAVCDCEPWAFGSHNFGGGHDGANWWDDCSFSSNATCNDHGYALTSGSDSECHCDTNFTGNHCELADDDGSCRSTEEWEPLTAVCQCKFQYSGELCDVNCRTQYCNGVTASCSDTPSGSDPLTCNCPFHVKVDGQQCAEPYSIHNCHGNGGLPDDGNYPICDCDVGFLQPLCRDSCRDTVCNSHGTCASGDQSGDQNCTCDTDWLDARCTRHQCSDNGAIVGIGQSCNCANGWGGSTCCDHVSNCNGRGDVIVLNGACVCDCPDDTEQPHCTFPVNETASDPDVHRILDVKPSIPSNYVHSRNVAWIAIGSASGIAVFIGIVVSGVYLYRHFKAKAVKLKAATPTSAAPKNTKAGTKPVAGMLSDGQGAFRRRLVHVDWHKQG